MAFNHLYMHAACGMSWGNEGLKEVGLKMAHRRKDGPSDYSIPRGV